MMSASSALLSARLGDLVSTSVAMSTACRSAVCRETFVPAAGTSRGRALRRATRLPSSSGDDVSTSPWWASLPEVHVLVFNPESPSEALYTVSRRDGDFAANDFVAFESLQDATRASVRVSDQLGEMPVVDSVDPRVIVFLANQCGYGVDVVPSGMAFEPPTFLIDESSSTDENNQTTSTDSDVLAISTADLKKYLADGSDFSVASDGFLQTDEMKTMDARRRAAAVMRAALVSPVQRVRGAVTDAVDAPARSMMTPMRAIQQSVRRASGTPWGRENLDIMWGEETPVPKAAQAVYRALIVIAEKRLNEMDQEG